MGSGTGNIYDYGFRIYNPRIAKFLSVDPLTKDFPMLTPFQYASNNPILFIDIDGLEGVQYLEITNKKDGTTEIKRVVEVDIHIAVSNTKEGKKLGHFNEEQYETIKNEINTEYTKGNFVDQDGFSVEFRFNFQKFDPEIDDPKSIADDFKKYNNRTPAECPNICISVPSVDNLVIIQAKNMGNTQGSTLVNFIKINKHASARGHTLGHEIAHFFSLRSPNNPSGSSIVEHNEQGGIWKYYGKDDEGNYIEWDINTGNYVPGSGPDNLTQENVDVILESMPEKDLVEVNE